MHIILFYISYPNKNIYNLKSNDESSLCQKEDWPVEHVKAGEADGEEDDENAVNEGKLIPMPVTCFHRPENL